MVGVVGARRSSGEAKRGSGDLVTLYAIPGEGGSSSSGG